MACGGRGTSGWIYQGGILYWDPGKRWGPWGAFFEPSDGWAWWRTQNQQQRPWGLSETPGGYGRRRTPGTLRSTGQSKFVSDIWEYTGTNHMESGIAVYMSGL